MGDINGRKIAGARVEAGLTAEELGTAAGVSGWAINSYERGRHQPRASTLAAIARELKRPLGYFLDGDLVPEEVPQGNPLGDTPAFADFAADRALLSVHAVTPAEVEALRQTRIVGAVPRNKEGVVKYLFLWREWGQ